MMNSTEPSARRQKLVDAVSRCVHGLLPAGTYDDNDDPAAEQVLGDVGRVHAAVAEKVTDPDVDAAVVAQTMIAVATSAVHEYVIADAAAAAAEHGPVVGLDARGLWLPGNVAVRVVATDADLREAVFRVADGTEITDSLAGYVRLRADAGRVALTDSNLVGAEITTVDATVLDLTGSDLRSARVTGEGVIVLTECLVDAATVVQGRAEAGAAVVDVLGVYTHVREQGVGRVLAERPDAAKTPPATGSVTGGGAGAFFREVAEALGRALDVLVDLSAPASSMTAGDAGDGRRQAEAQVGERTVTVTTTTKPDQVVVRVSGLADAAQVAVSAEGVAPVDAHRLANLWVAEFSAGTDLLSVGLHVNLA
jgi:hypothetical protein